MVVSRLCSAEGTAKEEEEEEAVCSVEEGVAPGPAATGRPVDWPCMAASNKATAAAAL